MLVISRWIVAAGFVAAVLVDGVAAHAELGQPSNWQIGLQQAATPVMDDIVWFHTFLLWIIISIVAFVLALLVVVMLQVQRARQSDAGAVDPQHPDRGDLDRGSGADPDRHRDPLVPPPVPISSTCRRPT